MTTPVGSFEAHINGNDLAFGPLANLVRVVGNIGKCFADNAFLIDAFKSDAGVFVDGKPIGAITGDYVTAKISSGKHVLSIRGGVGFLGAEAAMRIRGKLMTAGRGLRLGMGAILILLGGAILTGLDKRAETWLLNPSP